MTHQADDIQRSMLLNLKLLALDIEVVKKRRSPIDQLKEDLESVEAQLDEMTEQVQLLTDSFLTQAFTSRSKAIHVH